jgi:NAD(P)-dependent dehydrogenase (short-subunit alcohol dehydrogenase family)
LIIDNLLDVTILVNSQGAAMPSQAIQGAAVPGQTILVTGAGSGIGRAAALLAASRGARVVASDIDADAGRACADEIAQAGGKALALRCDVSDEQSVTDLFGQLASRGLTPTGLVAAAGIDLGGLAHELPAERWHRVLAVNLSGAFLVCRAALGAMLPAGRGGAIVLCSSPAAFAGFAAGGASAYAASKGGLSALTRTLAVDYARYGIRVNAIVPGPTETPLMWAAVADSDRAAMRARIVGEVPLGRLADPGESARAAIWLLSDEASYVTGSHLICDGGVLARSSISI